MEKLYQDATPNINFTGYREVALPGSTVGSVATPLFCPLAPILAGWGSTEDAFISVRGEHTRIYGADAFDIRSKYFNHANLFAKRFHDLGVRSFNIRMELPGMRRARGRLAIEVVKYAVPQYQRGADGRYLLDADNNKIPDTTTSTVAGHKVRLLQFIDDGTLDFKAGQVVEGTLVGDDGETSKIYPLFDFEGTHYGDRGNRLMVGISQPKVTSTPPVDEETVNSTGNMMYRFSVKEIPANGGTPRFWTTINETDGMQFSLDPQGLSSANSAIGFNEVYARYYQLNNQPYNSANIDGPVDSTHIYQSNIDMVLKALHDEESRDSVGTVAFVDKENMYSMNLFGPTDHNGVPYKTIAMADLSEMTEDTYLAGTYFKLGNGSDGDITKSNFEDAVDDMIVNFGRKVNLNNYVQYPFHFIVDSGYRMSTKFNLQSITTKRPEVAFLAATYVDGDPVYSTDKEKAVAAQLNANALLYPESTIFATPATRATILPYQITINNSDANSQWRAPTTLNYDLVEKLATSWGAADRVWNSASFFDTYPNNVIQHQILNFRTEPLSVRREFWGNNAIALHSTDHNEISYVGIQTVNPNDRSPLNSLVAVGANIHTTWACIRTYRHLAGRTMNAGVLVQESNDFIAEYTAGIPADKVQVIPNTEILPHEADDGYAWSSGAITRTGRMFTVNTVSITSEFFED